MRFGKESGYYFSNRFSRAIGIASIWRGIFSHRTGIAFCISQVLFVLNAWLQSVDVSSLIYYYLLYNLFVALSTALLAAFSTQPETPRPIEYDGKVIPVNKNRGCAWILLAIWWAPVILSSLIGLAAMPEPIDDNRFQLILAGLAAAIFIWSLYRLTRVPVEAGISHDRITKVAAMFFAPYIRTIAVWYGISHIIQIGWSTVSIAIVIAGAELLIFGFSNAQDAIGQVKLSDEQPRDSVEK